MTEAQKRAKAKYNQKVKRVYIDFYPTEADLLEHVNNQPKKQTYIKDLIRAEMFGESLHMAIRAEREAELMRTKAMMESREKWKANHPRQTRIVHCKDCIHYTVLPIGGECNCFSGEETLYSPEPNDYCSNGESKTK